MTASVALRLLACTSAAFSLAVLSSCSTIPATQPKADSTAVASQSPAGAPPANADSDEPVSPEAAFRAWLAASREPDTAEACGYMSDALVKRMLAEMDASGIPVADCAAMITATAELYAAFGESAEVEVETLAHEADRAELYVTYAAGDCGRVELVPNGGSWVMTQNAEDEC